MSITQIKDQIQTLEGNIRAIKKVLRSPWETFLHREQRKLLLLKQEITSLYVILARSRGKYHLADHDYCQAVFEEWQKKAA